MMGPALRLLPHSPNQANTHQLAVVVLESGRLGAAHLLAAQVLGCAGLHEW